jgi:hypothetical protein
VATTPQCVDALVAGSVLRADAFLLAAAPRLLAAAEAFIAELDSSGDFENWERVKAELRAAVQEASL